MEPDALELDFEQVLVRHVMWVLRSELSSEGAAGFPNCRPSLQAPVVVMVSKAVLNTKSKV